MLEPGVANDIIELLAANFKADEINELGKLIERDFDSHRFIHADSHITLSPRKCAGALVGYAEQKNSVPDLIKLIVDIDDGTIGGRIVSIDGLEIFLNRLSRADFTYDFERRRVLTTKRDVSSLVNWGSLKSGKDYPITIMSLDVVENSNLVRKNGTRKMEILYGQLKGFLRSRIREYDGRIWSFAGDGGILAFALTKHVDRAVRCALDIQCTIPLFNMRTDRPVQDPIALRLGLDTGMVAFNANTGDIVSDVINYAAHLEKRGTDPGRVSISEDVWRLADPKLLSAFVPAGVFEGKKAYTTVKKLDNLIDDCEHCLFEPVK